ncbi:lytic transglycosylase domain-containing protein [Sulfuriferula thiophila]|uniref:lytic transglycosylase domain-containing protein n=1 Tax=Sulfuriferula thiophila TaxID=1781211 RepID=UPI000F6057E6|nr:lytic transglycosylase domain-containing protein [Sulfuriferula thiophila]
MALCAVATSAHAGHQLYEPMAASVRAALSKAVSDAPVTNVSYMNNAEGQAWLSEMSRRLAKRMPDPEQRIDFLNTVHYEATRAGLDPELVLGLIEVESGFKKYAVSSVAARGYMQVMPFWTKTIGTPDQDLFHLRTNLRYGCNILRLYLDIEKGDLYRALGRYNGSLGKPEYPTMVVGAWKRHWSYTPGVQTVQQTGSVKIAGN